MNLKKSYKIANFQCLFKVLCAQVESFNSPDIVDKMPDSIKANIHKNLQMITKLISRYSV